MKPAEWIGCSLAVVLSAQSSPRIAAAQMTACKPTPQQAADAARGGGPSLATVVVPQSGYRVAGSREDALHARAWVLVARCDRQDAPLLALPTSGTFARRVLVVRAGDAVVAESSAADSRFSVAAVAEESGAAGERVRLRFVRPAAAESDGAPARQIVGVVRSAGHVEVMW